MSGLRQRQPVKRDKARKEYMAWIAQLPCVVDGREPVEVAHIRMGDVELGKRPTGTGEKPDDYWTVPLCAGCHRLDNDAQHRRGEREWWEARNINPVKVALHLQAIHEQTDPMEREAWARSYLASVREIGCE